MSCVIGLVTEDSVLMAADSSVCDGNIIVSNGFQKIVKMPTPSGDMVIGLVGAPLPGQVVRAFLQPAQNVRLTDTDEYVIKHLAPQIRELLIEHGAYGDHEQDHISGLIGLDGNLYYLDHHMSILKSTIGYEAVGSGREVALGSLYTTELWNETSYCLDPIQKIRMAMDAAKTLTAYVGGNTQIVEVKR